MTEGGWFSGAVRGQGTHKGEVRLGTCRDSLEAEHGRLGTVRWWGQVRVVRAVLVGIYLTYNIV